MTPPDDPMAAFESSLQRRRLAFKAIYAVVGGAMLLAMVVLTWRCVDRLRPRPRPSVRASEAAAADARAAAEEALERARAADEAFRRAIPEAIAAQPRGEGPCMYRLPTRSKTPGDLSYRLFMMRTISVGEPVPGSLLLGRVERAVAAIDEQLDKLYRTAEDADQAAREWADDLLDDTLEVVFVVERAQLPAVAAFGRYTGEESRTWDFTPGERAGWAYLWSFKFGAVVCAAPVTATSSDVLEFEAEPYQGADVAMERVLLDLEIRTEQAISAGLLGLPQP